MSTCTKLTNQKSFTIEGDQQFFRVLIELHRFFLTLATSRLKSSLIKEKGIQ